MIGCCSRCGEAGPLWPGTWLCDDCHGDDERETAELDRDYADPYDDEDWDDEGEPEYVRPVQAVDTRGLT